MIPTTVSRHVRDIIDRALRTNLARWHYDGFQAESRLDSTGDPAIFVKVRFVPLGEMPTSEATTRAMREIFDRLREDGDARIPYLDYPYPQGSEDDEVG